MRRLIVIAIFCLVTSCIVFLFSPLTTSSNAQDDSDRATNFPVVEQATGKKMPVDKVGIRRLKENTRESAVVSINEATGAAAFVRLANNKSVDLSVFKDSADARGKSDDFFRQYGSLFGIKNPAAELRYENETGEDNGAKHQTYQQFYNGVPVFAGTLKTHLDKETRLYAVNGTFVPEIEIDTNPVFTQTEAAAVAVAKVSEEKSANGLFAAKIELYVYRTGLIKGVPGNDFLTWQIEVTNNTDIREFVFIDAQTNKTVDQFTGIHDALSRRAYDGLSLPNVPPSYPAAPFWTEGQAFPTVSTEANNMILASKETYDVFKNAFNRDSFNGSGATMDSIFNRGYSCPNASWNGTFISFCAGLTTDDVTAHEWGHAYTEFTHGLIYQWQPGALNESYSDIYGEIIDRVNNRDNVGNSATDAARSPGICSGSTRWLLGEDATGGINGALRDMYNPNCFSDPGKVSDAVYVCSSGDSGGVHSNSGVPNHAFALLVDGGTYNGQTINAIGLTKAAHIYFRAMNIYQQRDSDFADHADALEQSANDLRIAGTNLAVLQTGLPSGQTITAADVSEVQKAILAVQMRTSPSQCNFVLLLAKNPPAEAVCGIGTARRTIFANDFEGGTSGWTVGKVETTGTFSLPDWLVTTGLPDNIPGKAFYASDPNVGSCSATGSQKGVRFLKSPTIQIPTGTVTNPTLSFDHWIALESGYDGAQLLISVNGGAFTLVPQANFLYNPHNTTLVTAGGGNDNPRASQRAWTGADGGAVSGSWGKTMVNLTGLVSPGNTVQFRWDLSTDGCGGTFGWYVDNIKVTSCLTPLTAPTIGQSFIPTSLPLGATGTMRFVVSNPNLSDGLSGIGFTNTLPNGISVATNTFPACNGLVTTTAPRSVSFTGGTLTTGANCTIDIGIGGSQSGVWNNTTDAVSANESGAGAASNAATLTVNAPGIEGDISPRPNQPDNPNPGQSGDGFITSGDVTQIRRFVLGIDTPDTATVNEFQKADTALFSSKGDGDINSGDLTQIRRYVLNVETPTNAAGPTVPNPPPSNLFAKQMSGQTKTDYLMSAARSLRIVRSSLVGNILTVGLMLDTNAADTPANSFNADINYDPAILSNPRNVRTASGATGIKGADNRGATANAEANVISPTKFRVLADLPGGQSFRVGQQMLVLIDFTVAAIPTSTTELSLTNIFVSDVNGSSLTTMTAPSQILVGRPTASAGKISGRIVAADGRAVFRARVALTDLSGEMIGYALTNPFGYYRFENAAVGQTYFINAEHKRYKFDSRVLSVNGSSSEVNLTATESVLNFKVFQ